MSGTIDIGVNLSNNRFSDDCGNVIERAAEAGVEAMILTGTSVRESQQVIELCKQYGSEPCQLFATAGIHPHDANDFGPTTVSELRDLSADPSVIAIGETGLDFNRNFSPREAQEKAFAAQLELAAELQMPLFMHERDAAHREADMISHYLDHLAGGVIHCFTGDKKALFRYLDMDLYIGITGWICDERRGTELQRLVANIPLDRLLVETDAPFLLPRNITPPPTNRRNEPAHLPWVIKGLAAHRSESIEQIGSVTKDNARRLFQLPGGN